MKKIWILLTAAIVIFIVLIYILIPRNIIVRNIIYTDIKPASILRCLHDDSKWQQWFPGQQSSGNFIYNNQQYKPGEKGYSTLKVFISCNYKNYASVITVFSINIDSAALQWELQIAADKNPIKRVQEYLTARKIKSNMSALLDSFKIFIHQTKNIYGFNINYTTLTDTALVSLKTITNQYPSTQLIYSMIDTLNEYITQQHATIHNYPMLNITPLQKDSYTVMVGIPTNVPLKGTTAIQPKRMMMIKNKTLVTDVKGDNFTIKQALESTDNFMKDFELTAPVIPFQQLVTDRSKVKDSTQWITRIFSPII